MGVFEGRRKGNGLNNDLNELTLRLLFTIENYKQKVTIMKSLITAQNNKKIFRHFLYDNNFF